MKALRNIFGGIAFIFCGLACVVFFFVLLSFLRQSFPLHTKAPPPTTTKAEPSALPRYLSEEEVVVVISPSTSATSSTPVTTILPVEKVLFEYIEVIDGCTYNFIGECLNVRSGPSTEYPSVAKLRNGVVLKVSGKVENASTTWYRIVFDEWIRYPERVNGNWYVAADHVRVLLDEGNKNLVTGSNTATSSKRIVVDRGEQKLYAYDGETLFMEEKISTGIELTPTPRGTFTIYKKTPSRYMQGPLPYLTVSKYYDLPGVPWNLYFTEDGAVVHGAYWHNSFGKPYSSGCVNLPPEQAHTLYSWAELGTTVTVQN